MCIVDSRNEMTKEMHQPNISKMETKKINKLLGQIFFQEQIRQEELLRIQLIEMCIYNFDH